MLKALCVSIILFPTCSFSVRVLGVKSSCNHFYSRCIRFSENNLNHESFLEHSFLYADYVQRDQVRRIHIDDMNEVARVELPNMNDRSEHDVPNKPDNFTMNMGKCIDCLRIDLPLLFDHAPNLDIFTVDIVLKDPKGTVSKGKRMYSAIFASLRLMSSITGMHPKVTVNSIVPNRYLKEIDVRLTFGFGEALTGEPVTFHAMSHYKLNEEGLVREQVFDSIIKRHLFEFSNNWATSSFGIMQLQRLNN